MKIIFLMVFSLSLFAQNTRNLQQITELTKRIEKLENKLSKGGQETGNGGGGFFCPSDSSVHLLDFWEGENLKNLKIKRNGNSIKEQLEEAIAELRLKGNGSLAGSVESEINRILRLIAQKKVYLPAGVAIAPPEDARHSYIKEGCILKGFAIYNDTYNTLEIDKSYFSNLTKTQKAGLIFHEAVYKVLRDKFKVSDSIVARNITACSFAKTPCEELDVNLGKPSKRYFECDPASIIAGRILDPSSVRVYKDVNNCSINNNKFSGWKIEVLSMGGYPVPTRTYIDFCPHLDLEPYLLSSKTSSLGVGGHQETHRAKSSDDRWKNIGLKSPIHVLFHEKGFFINGNRFYCRKR